MYTPRHLRKSGKYRRPTSQTPGKDKGDNCQASHDSRFFARRSRSYKHRGYNEWSQRYDGTKTGGQIGGVIGKNIGRNKLGH